MLSIPSILASSGDKHRIRRAFIAMLVFIGVLWMIRIMETSFGFLLTALGVHPGQLAGLVGVFTAPLIHGSFEHLVTNTLPLLILGTALLYGYPRSWWIAVPVIWLGSGLGVWFTGREVYHIGASGLTHGLMFFIFIIGVIRRDRLAIVLAMLVFFLYGGMVWGIFPNQESISFESHFWGATMGALCAILLKSRDSPPGVKRYEWENEHEDTEDPVIGDAWKQGSDNE